MVKLWATGSLPNLVTDTYGMQFNINIITEYRLKHFAQLEYSFTAHFGSRVAWISPHEGLEY